MGIKNMRDSILISQNDDTLISENMPEIINTDIGYNHEELQATPSDDLLVLRRAIYAYLKSPNLKKRNPNYLKLFRRLNEELKNRNLTEKDEFTMNKNKFEKIFLPSGIKTKLSSNNHKYENSNDLLKKKRQNEIEKQQNLSIPEFLQDKSKEKKEEFDFLSILDKKIEALKTYGVQKGNEKKNCVSTRIKEFMHEDHDDFYLNNEKSSIIDKELKDIQMSFAILDGVEHDQNFILN